MKNIIGLMSGSSCDGVDLALIKTDGNKIVKSNKYHYIKYDDKIKKLILTLIGNQKLSINNYDFLISIKELEKEITNYHINIVNDFLNKYNITSSDIDLISAHGHNILHNPQKKISWQLLDGFYLAKNTKINVITDFRIKDVIYGGNGAPLAPIYHKYLFQDYIKNYNKKIIIINLGGIANITYISNDQIYASDISYCNSILNDLVKLKNKKLDYDIDGKIGIRGSKNNKLIDKILSLIKLDYDNKYAFDRNDFHNLIYDNNNNLHSYIDEYKLEDLLYNFIYVMNILMNNFVRKFDIDEIILSGGGRKNKLITKILTENNNNIKVKLIDEYKIDEYYIDGDYIEAEAFAFLGFLALNNMKFSYPYTTSVNWNKDNKNYGGILYQK